MQVRSRVLRKSALVFVYFLATVQFVWCYVALGRPYMGNVLYEQGRVRMPFQGRLLMMFPMRWAHHSRVLFWAVQELPRAHFWFRNYVTPETVALAVIDVVCVLLAGWITIRIYEASSSSHLLRPVVYPLFLVVCAASYIMHTVQNFRFLYDLPSLALFSVAMYLMYFRWHWGWFAAVFCIATVNRETALLLLPLFMLNAAVEDDEFAWRRMLRARVLAVMFPLAVLWGAWMIFIHRLYANHASDFYPRFDWNLKSLALPYAWPQLLSAGGYLLLFTVVMRRRITDVRLRAWMWIVPVWLAFMFVYGILVETRIYGELIPLIVCATALIGEDMLMARMRRMPRSPGRAVSTLAVEASPEIAKAA